MSASDNSKISEKNTESPVPEAALDDEAVPSSDADSLQSERPTEFGGPKGLEPTRYGDWEKQGRCIDF